MLLSACGGQRQDANEPHGKFPVAVTKATFPPAQRLADHIRMVITVQNTGAKAIPNVAVTITDPGVGTAGNSFGQLLTTSEANSLGLAQRNRPVWIVDRPPGLCGFSCKSGGPGGAATAYNDTWALGTLKPGKTATFVWAVTAVKPGHYVIQYQIAAGLNGYAKAVLADGSKPIGRFNVLIRKRPQQSFVNGSGKVVPY
ncbi:MAG: DUF11 domain-containing protein [Solirubrobacterales bacterium]|nr:DUF11 domain-containing protein [Solirubrobacterales bacterium]